MLFLPFVVLGNGHSKGREQCCVTWRSENLAQTPDKTSVLIGQVILTVFPLFCSWFLLIFTMWDFPVPAVPKRRRLWPATAVLNAFVCKSFILFSFWNFDSATYRKHARVPFTGSDYLSSVRRGYQNVNINVNLGHLPQPTDHMTQTCHDLLKMTVTENNKW